MVLVSDILITSSRCDDVANNNKKHRVFINDETFDDVARCKFIAFADFPERNINENQHQSG